MESKEFCLEVFGDYACFTRPENKAERFSYMLPTPSSIRGIFSSIYLKPTKFNWIPTKVQVFNEILYTSMRRNEIKVKINKKVEPIDVQDYRTQRQTQALWNVKYRIWAKLHPLNNNPIAPLIEQFVSRAKRGQFFKHPCFGLREFPAFFELIEDGAEGTPNYKIPNLDVGIMLHNVFDQNDRSKTGTVSPSFFKAKIKDNICLIPDFNSEHVFKIKK